MMKKPYAFSALPILIPFIQILANYPFTILVDIDSTTADFDPYLLAKYNELYPTKPINESEIFVEHDGFRNHAIHDPRYAQELNRIMRLPGFFRHIPIIDGAKRAITEMISKNISIYFVSIPTIDNTTCADDKFRWIEEHFGKEMTKRLILTSDKSLVKGDFLIDDWTYVKKTIKPEWIHLLYTTKYNAHLEDRLRFSWETWEEDLVRALSMVGRSR